MKKRNDKDISYISMYKTALSYSVAADKLGFKEHFLQYIVLKSLSCEIFLKLIIFHKSGILIKKFHDLKRLSKFASTYQSFSDMLLTEGNLKVKDIKMLFNNVNNIFNNFRYIYENEGSTKVYYLFLTRYCRYLDDFCKNLLDYK